MEKKLYKNTKDKVICGVCSGLAKYLSIDATIVRLGVAFAALISCGTAVVAYVVCAIIIPDEPTNVIDAN